MKENKIYKNIISKLPKIKLTKDKRIMEWNKDYIEAEPGHRHISHLYALYPSHQINSQDKTLFEAAKNTISKRLVNGGGHTGWS